MKVDKKHLLIIGDDIKTLSLCFPEYNITLAGSNYDDLILQMKLSMGIIYPIQCDLNNWIILASLITGSTVMYGKYDYIIIDSNKLNAITLKRIIPSLIDNASDNVKMFHILGEDKNSNDKEIQEFNSDCNILNNINILSDNKKWVRDDDFIDNLYNTISEKI